MKSFTPGGVQYIVLHSFWRALTAPTIHFDQVLCYVYCYVYGGCGGTATTERGERGEQGKGAMKKERRKKKMNKLDSP